MSRRQQTSGPCFVPGPLLLPKKDFSVEQWAVPATDQFAEQPDLWRELESMKQGRLTLQDALLPDAFLFKVETSERARKAANAMNRLMQQELTRKIEGYIYLERTLPNGTVRQGLVGLVDLEQYSFEEGQVTPIRAPLPLSAQQVLPRLELRQQAALESSHIMLAADDRQGELFGMLANKKSEWQPVYQGTLCYGGGSVCGWQVNDPQSLQEIARTIAHWQTARPSPALIPISGNADLAAAKVHWMLCKEELEQERQTAHPARFCLAELCNLYDEGVRLAPVHRVVMGVQGLPLLAAFRQWCKQQSVEISAQPTGQSVRFVYGNWQQDIWLKGTEKLPLAAGILDGFLQEYLQWNPMCSVDYITEPQELLELAADGTTGLLLPDFCKEDIVRGVAGGAFLPRNPFVMDAMEHRYELECRAIDTP